MQQIPGLYIVDDSEKGRGVYTALALTAGSTIEICPVIVVPREQVEALHHTLLHDYYFTWPDGNDSIALALGYGSLYNHSSTPNALFIMDLPRQEMIVACKVDIAAGEEITIDYTGDDEGSTWFTVVE